MSIVTLGDLARLVQGTLHGDGDLPIDGAETLKYAGPTQISLAVDAGLAKEVSQSTAAAVVVPRGFVPDGLASIEVDDVSAAFVQIVEQFRPQHEFRGVGVSPQAFVDDSAQLDEGVDVYPGAYIGPEVRIGKGSVIHSGARILAGTRLGCEVIVFPNAVVYENCLIGDRCILHAGSSIGAYGFGYDSSSGKHILCAQLGNAVLEDDVEVGVGSAVDRGTYGSTVIGAGTKMDNQVMVGHNCRIGKHNLLCSQVGIAGSCTTGDYVVMAGQVGIGDHLDIADKVILGAKAGVMTNVPRDETWVGIPATPMREQLHKQAALAKLPQMRKQFRELQQQIADLAAAIGESSESTAQDQQDAA